MFGLFQAPYYAVSATATGDIWPSLPSVVCPNDDQRAYAPRLRQHVFCPFWYHQPCCELAHQVYHSCFSPIGQSSIIGPNVVQAIVNSTRNDWMGFPFLFAICAAAMIAIGFVDVEKGREDSRKFVQAKRAGQAPAENAHVPR